jgi:hypothetical protein
MRFEKDTGSLKIVRKTDEKATRKERKRKKKQRERERDTQRGSHNITGMSDTAKWRAVH